MRALCWGSSPWGVRRILSHIRGLPPESASARHSQGAHAGWTQEVELQASLLDALRMHTYYYLSANGSSPAVPEPFPRPGISHEPDAVSLSDFNAFLKG